MQRNWGLWAALLALALGIALVRLGTPGEQVTLRAAAELWADVLRDTQELGLSVTRMSDREEMALGRQLAAGILLQARQHTVNAAYVAAIGRALAPHVQRKGIQYEFHVIVSPGVNAFALPGGQVFIFTGLLDRLESEAEVAMILGHEMAHVDQYHVAELYQLVMAGRRLGLGDVGQLAELLRRMAARGYAQHQEAGADSEGFHLAVQAGYHPAAGPEVWVRLSRGGVLEKPANSATPLDEAAAALGGVIASYANTHPSDAERFRKLGDLVRNLAPDPPHRTYYVGRENHKFRLSRENNPFPGELLPR